MKKSRFLTIVAAFLLAAAGLAGFSLSSCNKGTNIVIGTGEDYEPFCYRDSQGNLTGFDIEVVREIERRLPQYKYSFEIFDFKNLLVALATGKIDVAAHEYEENPERRKTYLYGDEGYNDYDSYVLVKADGPWASFTGIDDFAGRKDAVLAVSTGSNHEAFIKTWNSSHDAEHQLYYTSYDDGYVLLTNIANGTNAGSMGTLLDVKTYNIKMPALNVKPIGKDPIITSQAYFLFNKDNIKLKNEFDGALRDMKADGTLEKIKNKVFDNYFESLKNLK